LINNVWSNIPENTRLLPHAVSDARDNSVNGSGKDHYEN